MKRKIAPSFIRASFDPKTYNETDNTVEIVFATEAEVLRNTWDGKFIEVLELSEGSVRLERLNAGAPVLDNHSTWSVRNQIGVVEKAWLDKKTGRALIRLSERDDVKGIVQDVKSGILRNISVGYRVFEYTQTEKPKDEVPTLRATDWEPMELSLVTVPADFKAGVRSEENTDLYEVEIITQNTRKMPDQIEVVQEEGATVQTRSESTSKPAATTTTVVDNSTLSTDTEAVRSQGATAERTRIIEINNACRAANISDEPFITDLISRGITIDNARKMIIDKLAEDQNGTLVRNQTTVVTGTDESLKVRNAMEEVLLHRENPTLNQLTTDKAKELRHASLMDLAIISLQQRGEAVSLGSMSKDEIVKRAMSSSDYPILLGNTINRSLRAYYEAAPSEWKKLARKRNASDFKALSSVNFGGSMKLEEIKEGGEYKQDTFKETGDSFKLKTWGKKISITRQAIINDDLGGFMRYTEMFGRGAAELQAEIAYGLITMNSGGGRKLYDGKNLFHADHKNLASAGSAMILDTLNAGRISMQRQKGLKDEKITIRPKYLLVPLELELLAKQLINSTIVATQTSNTNPLANAFEIITDVYLDDPKAWYIVADPATVPVIEYAFLNGQEGLYTEQQVNFDTDNLDIKVRTDFNATIEEFRGIYKNAGPS